MKKILFLTLILFSNSYLIYCQGKIETSLLDFILHINKTHQITFALDDKLLSEIDLQFDKSNFTLSNLNEVLKKSGLDYYYISENKILLRKSTPHLINQNVIKGKIVDEEGNVLPMASVYLNDMSKGLFADEKGNFSISINDKAANDSICISYLGFENICYSVKNIPDEITLKNKNNYIADVTIIASLMPLEKIKTNYSDNYYMVYNLDKEDFARLLQKIPGINKTNNAGIQIRGMTDDKTLSIVDDMPILKSGHFFNIISNFNELYFDNAQVYKNYYPPQYSNALGGIVKYQTKKDKINSFQINANLLYTSAHVSKTTKNIDIETGIRKSYIGLNDYGFLKNNLSQFNNSDRTNDVFSSEIPKVDFIDFNSKLTIRVGSNFTSVISGMLTDDSNIQDAATTKFFTIFNQKVKLEQKFTNQSFVKNQGLSLSNSFNVNEKNKLEMIAYHYKYNEIFNLDNIISEIPIFDPKKIATSYFYNQQISNSNFKFLFHQQYNANTLLNYGLEYDYNRLFLDNVQDGQDLNQLSQNINQYHGWGELKLSYKKFYLNTSLRLSKFETFEGVFLQPQASLIYSASENIKIKSSVSRRAQNLNKLYFETVFGQNIQYFYLSENGLYPIQQSNNYSAGLTFNSSNFYADAEMYYNRVKGNLLYTTLIGRPLKDKPFNNTEFKLFSGNSENFGIDLLMGYKHQNFSHSIAYSYNKNNQKYEGIYQSMPIPAPDNRPHTLNISNEYRIKKISINHNFLFMSGTQFLSYRNSKGLDKNQAPRKLFTEKIPDYLSLDLGVTFSLPFDKYKFTIGFIATNLSNNKNIKYIQQTGVFQGVKDDKPLLSGNEALMLGRFYNVQIGLKF